MYYSMPFMLSYIAACTPMAHGISPSNFTRLSESCTVHARGRARLRVLKLRPRRAPGSPLVPSKPQEQQKESLGGVSVRSQTRGSTQRCEARVWSGVFAMSSAPVDVLVCTSKYSYILHCEMTFQVCTGTDQYILVHTCIN